MDLKDQRTATRHFPSASNTREAVLSPFISMSYETLGKMTWVLLDGVTNVQKDAGGERWVTVCPLQSNLRI